MNFSKQSRFGLILFLVTLSAFGIHHFSRKPMLLPKHANTPTESFIPTPILKSNKKITIECKKLDHLQCRDIFRCNLIKKGFQPISIIIENDTDHYIKFSPSDVTLKTVPRELVAQKAQSSGWLPNLIMKMASFAHPVMSVPGAVHSALESRANNTIFKKVVTHSSGDQLIEPKTILESSIFVEEENYQDTFDMYLTDKETNGNIFCSINMSIDQPFVHYV